ncbi:like-Sm domain-containing protein, partial [Daldinia vernicosa]|uniref:like-Sm domain-containing protein n=1 Tax=Daldinia vernicosa TaxID=114800 RepID=UPI002007479E
MLQDLVNKDIVVRLKWGETEYRGRLVSSDSYMNIQLTNAQEFIDQKFTSDLGQILIRCVPFSSLPPSPLANRGNRPWTGLT